MHTHNLFSDRKRKSTDEENPSRKKRRVEARPSELFPLSDINYYKKIIGNWVYLWPSLTPSHILINLLLYKKNETINYPLTIFQDRSPESHLNFEESLLKQLGYSEESYLPDRNGTISIFINNQANEKEWRLLPLLNSLLETIKINPKDKLFSLLIAFLDYYNDYFRLHLDFNLDLDSFPHFKKQLFIPMEIYQSTQKSKREISVSEASDALLLNVKKDFEKQLKLLTLVKLSDHGKERQIKKLLLTALCRDSTRQDPDIKWKRKKACVAIKNLGKLSQIDTYLKEIALPMHSFDRDQFVRRTGCELLGDVYPFVSEVETKLIFQKLMNSLQNYRKGKEEALGACRALMKMKLSFPQIDEAFSILIKLIKVRDNALIKQTIWSLDLSDEQFKMVLSKHGIRNSWFLGDYFFNFLERKEKKSEFYSYLIEWCLAQSKYKYFLHRVLSSIPIPDSKQLQMFEILNKILTETPAYMFSPLFYKALAATKQADSLLSKGMIDLLENNLTYYSNCRINVILDWNILRSIHFSADNLFLLKTALLKKFHSALEGHTLNNLLQVFRIKEQVNCDIPEIHQTIVIEHFPSVKLAILILENLNIRVEVRHIVFFYKWIYTVKQLPHMYSFDFADEVNKLLDDNKEIDKIASLLQEEKISQSETRPLLMKLKHLLSEFLFKILDHECFHANRRVVYDMVFYLLRQFQSPSILYDLEKFIFNYEMQYKNMIDRTDINRMRKLTNNLCVILKEILSDFVIENKPHLCLNFLAYLEKENEESPPSFYRFHLIEMIREDSAKLVLLNLIGREHYLPTEVTQHIASFVYK